MGKENKDTKTIAIYGCPKVGKNFSVSLFAEEPYIYIGIDSVK